MRTHRLAIAAALTDDSAVIAGLTEMIDASLADQKSPDAD
jgi:hypothetical protein